MGSPQHFIIIAGETSGDMRAAGLARALKEIHPNLKLSGIGGEYMRNAGVECFEDITSLAVIGLVEVIKHFGRIKAVFEATLKRILTERPDAVIFVDYPGFNLRLADAVKQHGIKTIYYISPQVWAWREKRIHRIKKIIDCMIVLFPFEKDIYAKYGMVAHYVGHPLVDEVKSSQPRSHLQKQWAIPEHHAVIGLLPGSRDKEIERHLPLMLQTAQHMQNKNPKLTFVLLKAPTISADTLLQHIRQSGISVVLFSGNPYDALNMIDAAIVASGTATLETALMLKPMIIVYQTSAVTYAIAKQVVKIPYIGLVNIVAGKKVVEEFIQQDMSPPRMAKAMEELLEKKNYQAMVQTLRTIKNSLGEPGASQRAAKIVLQQFSH